MNKATEQRKEIISRQVEPSRWEQFSKENVAAVELEIASSAKLRIDVEEILTLAARQLRSQADSVENALEKRIGELEEARQGLEQQLDQVLKSITEVERLKDDLRRATFNIGIPLRVAHQRLQIRKARPQPNENCNDSPQFGLLGQVHEADSSAEELKSRLEEASARLAQLIKMRGHLESEIRVKRHSLHIDKMQCREIRAHYPSTLDMSG